MSSPKAFLRNFFLLILVVSTLIGIIYSLWFYLTNIAPFSGRDFNQKEWAEALKGINEHDVLQKELECIRCGMVSDLRQNYLKKGIHISSVTNLLGETEIKKYDDFGSCLSYFLGGDTTQDDQLLVCFDADKNIKETYHYHHNY